MMGVGVLIIGVILVLVIVTTLLDADLFSSDDRTTTYINEQTKAINETGITFGNSTLPGATCVVDVARNGTDEIVASGNYTVSGCTLTYSASDGVYNNTVWKINSTTTYYGESEIASRGTSTNFTAGVDNISEKIPTILLIVAVVFLFGALVLLMRNAQQMGVGGGGSL